jgi:4-alpha-glucanotransferase
MAFSRSSGVLLHPTSLPGRFGIGDLGPSAADFVGFLASARQHLWQVLTIGPSG